MSRAAGTVVEIRTAVIEGNSYYFIRLQNEDIFYSISAAQNRDVVTLNVGDTVTIEHAVETSIHQGSILNAYSLTIDSRVPILFLPPAIEDNAA